jgi:hypothetical protein
VNTADQSPAPRASEPSAPWFQRVFPVVGLALVLVGALALFVPDVRTQLRLSVTREPESFVEMYFVEAPRGTLEGGQTTCARRGSKVMVDFVLRSHLTETQRIAYSVRIDPTGPGKTRRSAGEVQLRPGSSTTVHQMQRLGARAAYVVTVRLPGRDQYLRARCRPGRQA